jgi:hypothetical protein
MMLREDQRKLLLQALKEVTDPNPTHTQFERLLTNAITKQIDVVVVPM